MDYTDLPLADCQQGSEGELLLFALDRVHKQFAWKTGGLDAEQLGRRHPPSTMTLAGLIKHLALVELTWTARALGESPGPPADEVDRSADPEWEWRTAVTDGPEVLYDLWYRTAARTRQIWGQIVADDRLDATVPWGSDDYVVNLRRVLVDILEENLLHTGHASMLREAVDGLIGNDPP
ncbi:mycothiol transferase [Microlunatus phosphovorus]|nr:DUF664 domain-containing protein [Microlunatus phosphovorus]